VSTSIVSASTANVSTANVSTANLRNKRIDKKSFGCWQGRLDCCDFELTYVNNRLVKKFVDFVNSLYSTDAVLDWRCTWLIIWRCNNYNELASEYEYSECEYSEREYNELSTTNLRNKRIDKKNW
jgi:hypothetical protein